MKVKSKKKIESEIKDLKLKLSELEEYLEKCKFEIPNLPERFKGYVVNEDRYIASIYIEDPENDYVNKHHLGNIFGSYEEAEEEIERRLFVKKYQKFIKDRNDGWEMDFSNRKMKGYYIYMANNSFGITYCTVANLETRKVFLARSEEILREAIDLFEDDLRYLFI